MTNYKNSAWWPLFTVTKVRLQPASRVPALRRDELHQSIGELILQGFRETDEVAKRYGLVGCDLKELAEVTQALHTGAEQLSELCGQLLKRDAGERVHVEAFRL